MEDIPIIDINSKKFDKELSFEMFAADGSTCYRNDRDRPYNGQHHTDQGARGKLVVKGLTMRDINDCFIMGFLDASGLCDRVKAKEWRYADVYRIEELGGETDIDFIAVVQNMSCHMEKMMGVYPYLPSEAIAQGKRFMKALKKASEEMRDEL